MIRTATAAILLMFALPVPAHAERLADLASQCQDAVQAGNAAAFEAIASEIVKYQNVFDTALNKAVVDCLSQGSGEPWEYDWPSGEFKSSADVVAGLRAADAAEAAKARKAAEARRLAADLAVAREENAARVATLVYAACSTLLDRDQVAAMTNPVCIESFLASGLPQP
jgi:hypothetical protein